jgi:hypothetical protein
MSGRREAMADSSLHQRSPAPMCSPDMRPARPHRTAPTAAAPACPLIELDPWGYPILLSPAVPASVMDHARLAVDACPTLALLLEEVTGLSLLS